MKNSIAILILLVSLTAFHASAVQRPEDHVRSVVNSVITVLRDGSLTPGEKESRVVDIIDPLFDYALMAKLSLGRKYWSQTSPQKRDAFSALFKEFLQNSYRSKIKLYKDEKVVLLPSLEDRGKVSIPTILMSNGNEITIDYRLYKTGDAWKVYDIEIEAVSIISTYRSQYDQLLSSGSIDDLLEKLKNQIKEIGSDNAAGESDKPEVR